MSTISFADIVHQSIIFSEDEPTESLILELIDSIWFQRLREIGQTANTRLLYMFSEHSRFGHCIGVAYLTLELLRKLKNNSNYKDFDKHKTAVAVAALLHDIGHLAPGSHVAQQMWFPKEGDSHEEISCRIILENTDINRILSNFSKDLPKQVSDILSENKSIPAWTWEIISGGGWNTDRGNWCIVDSILSGVQYGKYNIPALTDSMLITDDGHLALKENRIDAMLHFVMSRHALYRQVYQHRVLLASDTLSRTIVERARSINLNFSDETMKKALNANSHLDLELSDIYNMRESWWRYHLHQWSNEEDQILSDLSSRLINRNLFKTVKVKKEESIEELKEKATKAVIGAGYDPKYYLHVTSTKDVHKGDKKHSMSVITEDNKKRSLKECEELFEVLVSESKQQLSTWLVMPEEAKAKLGRKR